MSHEMEVDPASPEVENEQYVDPEVFARDFGLTQRVKNGHTPHVNEDGTEGRIIDGHLNEDAAEALGELWLAYRRSTVKAAYGRAESLDEMPAINVGDLANESYFGIYHAAIKWNPDRGRSFQLYATIMVGNYMNWYIDDHSTAVRAPRGVRQAIRRADRTYWGAYGRGEGAPTEREVAKKLGLSLEKYQELRRTKTLTNEMASLDGGYSERAYKGVTVGPAWIGKMNWLPVDITEEMPPSIIHDLIVEDLDLLVGNIKDGGRFPDLKSPDRRILYWRYLDPAGQNSQREVAEEMDISPQRVSQREIKALKNLREALAARRLTDYLDVDD